MGKRGNRKESKERERRLSLWEAEGERERKVKEWREKEERKASLKGVRKECSEAFLVPMYYCDIKTLF